VTLTATDNLGFVGSTSQQVGVWGPLGPPVPQTGAAADIGVGSATVTGTVAPDGVTLGYRFDYGPSAADLNAQTTEESGPSGSAPAPVSANLTGLAANTTYFYRLDAVVDGYALPGPVLSFRTAAPAAKQTTNPVARLASAGSREPRRHARRRHARRRRRTTTRTVRRASRVRTDLMRAPAPVVVPVSAQVVGGQSLADVLRRGLRVSFRCPGRCAVELAATLRLPAALDLVAVPRVLASGVGRTSTGSGTARLSFTASASAWLARDRRATFAVSGFSERAG
jgi:hypothetical protein